MFIPSDTAMISASVLDLELSFCSLELAMKYPTPKVTHVPEVDLMSFRFANAASIDTMTCGGRVHFNLSGTSRTDFTKLMALSSLTLVSQRSHIVTYMTVLCPTVWHQEPSVASMHN